MNRLKQLLMEHSLFVLFLSTLLAASWIVWHFHNLQNRMIEASATESASLYSQALAEFRSIYTSEVVERVRDQSIEISHDYKEKAKAIPLPATLSMELGKNISKHRSGAETRLYSPYPFPWRKETGGLRDNFAKEAWRQLSAEPEKPFYRFEEYKGRRALRYATADRMRPSCVDCHNTHPDTPKMDWKAGDLRGVLEIVHPVDNVTSKTASDLKGTIGLVATLCGIGIFSVAVVVGRLKHASKQLAEANDDLAEQKDNLEEENEERRQIEEALRESGDRYRTIFEDSPIPLLEADFSGVRSFIRDLESSETSDIRRYFQDHPVKARKCLGLVRILDVNQATLELYRTEDKRAFVSGFGTIITDQSLGVIQDELATLAEGKCQFEGEVFGQTFEGESLHSFLRLSIPPGFEDTWSKVIVSIYDMTERKRAEAELEKLHRQVIDASRQAGMAEVATGVLHDVGNVLNSVNVSSTLIAERLRSSKTANLSRIATLLHENESDLGGFMMNDRRGQTLPAYLSSLSDHVREERTQILGELESLTKNVDHIKDIIARQQSYAKVSGALETLSVDEIVEDAIRISIDALKRHHVEIDRNFEPLPPIPVDKHKVLQILINLINNAKHALDERGENGRRLTIEIGRNGGEFALICVSDNGIGIESEKLTEIFSHGYTTKSNGHGFGLHSSANAASEMGGSLTADSEGLGCGATFTLELPIGIKHEAIRT